ncbi:MAG: hypothetical protein KC503_15030 [Myxococcales bacterium]|nr:hypothetical protein [Myxococcales bacterium]
MSAAARLAIVVLAALVASPLLAGAARSERESHRRVAGNSSQPAKTRKRRRSKKHRRREPRKPTLSDKVKKVIRGPLGITFVLHLDSAPYPARGAGPYRDPTVVVFVPRYYRVDRDRRLDILLHFHGHRATAAGAIKRFQLDKQLYDSRQNAILVAPQGPVRANDSRCGKLDKPKGLVHFLGELRRTLQARKVRYALKGAIPSGYLRVGKLVISAHSGGYRVTARILEHGGFPVSEVYLFDAMYADHKKFAKWLLATRGGPTKRRRKLVSYLQDTPVIRENQALMAMLDKAKYRYKYEKKEGTVLSRRALSHYRAIFIRTQRSHSGLQWRNNALRDCLFASTLRRFLRAGWYKQSKGPRPIDKRTKR